MPDHPMVRATAAPTIRAMMAPDTWNDDARTVEVIFTTGAPVERYDWMTGRTYLEVLEVSENAVDLERLNAGAPVLDTHSSWSLGSVIGVVERAWVADGEGRAVLRFSTRDDVAPIVADVAAGIIRNVSVGYWSSQTDVKAATKDSPEVRTVRRWTPGEISLVPVPADAGAQVRSSFPIAQPQEAREAPEVEMPDENVTTDTGQVQAPAPDNSAAIAAERARVADIMTVARQGGMDADWTQRMIATGTTADAARAAALEAVAARATPRVPAEVAGARQDEGDTVRRLLSNALEHRGNVPGVTLEDGARQFRGFRMLDFARYAVELGGGSTRGLTPVEVFREAMRMGQVSRLSMRSGPSHVTGDFPDLLANTASKMLRATYGSAPRTFTAWSRQVNLPDFKSFKTVALSGASVLQEIAEDAEVTYGTLGDDAETWNLVRYGRALAISYVALVNDDMSGFTRIPAMFGAAAARLESTTVYGILTANAAMADGVALFHSTHSNTSTGVLSVDATGVANVGAAVTKLRLQTAPNGDIIGLTARYLVVPATLEIKAAQLFSPAIVPATAGAINPMRTTMQVIGEPRLDATSTAAYYVMASPDEIDTVHYGYLDGEAEPVITSDIDFDTDGMKTKVMHNFGAKAIDWRGMVYSTGA